MVYKKTHTGGKESLSSGGWGNHMEATPYEILANAVVIQAAKDFVAAKERLIKHPYDTEAKIRLQETEDFFMSDRITFFTAVDGNMIINKLRTDRNACRALSRQPKMPQAKKATDIRYMPEMEIVAGNLRDTSDLA